MTTKRRILVLLDRGPSRATNLELAREFDVSMVTVDNCLHQLEAEGKISRRKVGRNREISLL